MGISIHQGEEGKGKRIFLGDILVVPCRIAGIGPVGILHATGKISRVIISHAVRQQSSHGPVNWIRGHSPTAQARQIVGRDPQPRMTGNGKRYCAPITIGGMESGRNHHVSRRHGERRVASEYIRHRITGPAREKLPRRGIIGRDTHHRARRINATAAAVDQSEIKSQRNLIGGKHRDIPRRHGQRGAGRIRIGHGKSAPTGKSLAARRRVRGNGHHGARQIKIPATAVDHGQLKICRYRQIGERRGDKRVAGGHGQQRAHR